MKKKALKGFTLIEMIIVVALFGMIITIALSLLDPVNKIYKSAFNSSDTQSISESLRIYVEDNLQYADRIAVYTNIDFTDDELKAQVGNFRSKYYFSEGKETVKVNGIDTELSKKRIFPHSSLNGTNDEVYVLMIDNPDDSVVPGSVVSASSNIGTITLRKFVGGTEEAASGLNGDYYKDYAFKVQLQTLGAVDDGMGGTDYKFVTLDETASSGVVSPNNFAMLIDMYKKNKNSDDHTKSTLEDTYLSRTISFKLKNIVSATDAITSDLVSFNDTKILATQADKVTVSAGITASQDNADTKVHFNSENVRRFAWYDNTMINSEKLTSGLSDDTAKNDVYIIFTKPTIDKVLS